MLKSYQGWVYLYYQEVLIIIKAITAFDDLKKLGQRTIAFEDDSVTPSSTTLVAFPENCGSLLYEGTVYDWYGRKASPVGSVKRVIGLYRPNAKDALKIGFDRKEQDQYIVEDQNGEYHIAVLQYHAHRKIQDPNYSGTKYSVTGGFLDRAPYLDIAFTICDPALIKRIKNHEFG